MKKLRLFSKPLNQKKRETSPSNLFVFCEKNSGLAQFRGTSTGSFDCTIERIAGLLAMQCLVRGQSPRQFDVMVPADESLVDRLVARAEELLEEGRAVVGPASLSQRQREVLHSVMENLANKEIASKLNITVRTVKFHISTLLDKFGVDSRAELARRAAGFLRPMILEEVVPPIERRGLRLPDQELESIPLGSTLQMATKPKTVRFSSRVLTA